MAGLGVNKFDVVVSVATSPEDHSQSLLLELWKVLKPSGSIKLLELFDRTFELSSRLSNNLTLAGFSNQTTSAVDFVVMVTSTKPKYTTGASQPIKLKKKAATAPADPWTSTGSSAGLVDENSLLTEADLAKPIKTDDCEAGSTKKACKNCSCGRADQPEEKTETKPKLTMEMIENPAVNSSCGSCGLGDAFRCGGCPYRGLPSFKPGERIVLPNDFDMDLIES